MIIKCKMCGGDLNYTEGSTVCECEYCGSRQTLPKLNADSDRKANLFDRASHFRRAYDYDKAMGIYEQILNEDGADAEAYWGIVLCRYGIEYVEDPASGKRVPTINRVQYTSILTDEDYKAALTHADSLQRPIYEEEAAYIDSVQKGILEISRDEEPYDVFICYKETDENGQRTHDSQDAQEVYYGLTEQGYKVFFSRITLEDKLGREYEPYIFAALNSAKVMVVIGSKPEYFNAVWVKNEWGRYLALMKNDRKRLLIPCYKGMDPYELPDALSSLQSQNMGNVGFMQDLLRGIKKVLDADKKPEQPQPQVIVQNNVSTEVTALLDRAFMALEDGEFATADDFCEQALNKDAKNARAYLGKLMAELKIRKESDLQNCAQPIERSANYAKALRFADDKIKAQLTGANDAIKNRLEQVRLQGLFNEAMAALNGAHTVEEVRAVRSRLTAIKGYDTSSGLAACDKMIEAIYSKQYDTASRLLKECRYDDAGAVFRSIGDYRDSKAMAAKCDELEKERLAQEAAAKAEQARLNAERKAKQEAARKEKERAEAEKKRQQEEIARRAAEAKAARTKKIGIIAAIVAVLCIAAFFVVTKVVIPGRDYGEAMKLLQAGRYDEAIDAFTKLDGYSDSGYRISQAEANKAFDAGKYDVVAEWYGPYMPEIYKDHVGELDAMYSDALALLNDGHYDEAIAAFTRLGSYKDCEKLIKQATYRKACALMSAGDRAEATELFTSLNVYKDSKFLIGQMNADTLYERGNYADAWTAYSNLFTEYHTHDADYEAMYAAAEAARTAGDYDSALDQFVALGTYQDAAEKAAQCKVDKADALYTAGKYDEAAAAYADIGNTEKADESIYLYAGDLAARGEYLQAAQQYETIMTYQDSQEQHYQMGLKAQTDGKLTEAIAIFSVDPDYRDTKEIVYQIGVKASSEQLYEVSVPAFACVGAYKDAAMKLSMDTYAWGAQLYDNANYDKAAEVFASMGNFSDAATRAKESAYAAAGVAMTNGNYDDAAARFAALGSFSDSADKAKAAAYAAADEKLEAGSYADAKARFTKLGDYSDSKSKAQECDYHPAMALFNNGDYAAAKTAFVALGSYSNSADMAKECDYIPAKALYTAGQYQDALNAFTAGNLIGYSDSDTIMNDCRYQLGKAAMESADYSTACDWFDAAGSYSDSKAQAAECRRLSALDTAQSLETAGKYGPAYTWYEMAGETGKMQETAYQAALGKMVESNYEAAITWYEKAGDYSDAKEQILSIGEYYYSTQQYDAAEAVYVKVLGTGNAAQRLYELGQYYELVGNNEHAAKCYREAGEYQDAPEKAVTLQNEVTYQAAESLFQAKDWEGARTEYLKISGYKDVDSKVATCDDEIAAVAAARRAELTTVGKTFTFGHYEQDNDTGNGKEAIEWQVLDVKGDKVLIISKNTLDAKAYNNNDTGITWEKCTLRTWLNKDFLSAAFSAAEQAGIETTTVDNSKAQGYSGYSTYGGNNTQDKIFLLSYAEAWKYFGSDSARVSTPTKYAAAQSSYSNRWWLRSPGGTQGGAAIVFSDGSRYIYTVNLTRGVRPALWVNLESGIFKSYISTGSWQ